ncbi:hypothetical protein AA313_de0200941 [Arthrobotrys entomopaga]|nr:hypothetical protein AA313_de0200941 [Arthrobotrys entomopaga]
MRFLRYLAAGVGVAASLVHAAPGKKQPPPSKNQPAANPNLPSAEFQAGDADFTFNFEEDGVSGNAFKQFITRSRDHIGSLLRAAPKSGPEYYNVILRTEKTELKVKLQKHDLYLVAYGSNDIGWKEVKNEAGKPKLFSNTEPLPFRGDYPNLGSYAKYENPVLKVREQTVVGKYQVKNAIETLGSKEVATTKAGQLMKKSPKLKLDLEAATNAIHAREFTVLTQMLPESIRLKSVSNYFATHWDNGKAPDKASLEAENGWSTASKSSSPDVAVAKCKRKRDCMLEFEPEKSGGVHGPDEPERPSTGVIEHKPGNPNSKSLLKGASGKALGGATALGAVVVGCALSAPLVHPEDKPHRLARRRIPSWHEFWSGIWSGFKASWNSLTDGSNWEAFKESGKDLGKGIKNAVNAPGEQLPKIWSKETGNAIVKSLGDLRKGLEDAINAPGRQLPRVWSTENTDAFVKSTNDLVTAIQEIPDAFVCGFYDLREAAQDVAIAFAKAPGQVASELQKFDKGLDNLGPDGKKAFYAVTSALGTYAPDRYDQVGYMAPAVCHLVSAIGHPTISRGARSRCPSYIATRFNKAGEVVKKEYMKNKENMTMRPFWDTVDLSIWAKVKYLEVHNKEQGDKAWEALKHGRTPENLPEMTDEDKLKLWRLVVTGSA